MSKKSDLAFTVEEDVSLPSRAAQPPSPPPDPIAELKKQIEQAKATKVRGRSFLLFNLALLYVLCVTTDC